MNKQSMSINIYIYQINKDNIENYQKLSDGVKNNTISVSQEIKKIRKNSR